MKRPFFSVFPDAVIIIQPVGQVRALLHLRDETPAADCMNGSGRNEENIVLSDRHPLQMLLKSPVLRSLPHSAPVHVMREAIDQIRAGSCVHDVPHLALAELSVFMLPCVCIIRMHLHRKIGGCIDELDENRKLPLFHRLRHAFGRVRAEHPRILLQQLVECFVRVSGKERESVGVRRALPGFRKGRQRNILGKIIPKPSSSPQVILSCGEERNRSLEFFGFRFPVRISVCHVH